MSLVDHDVDARPLTPWTRLYVRTMWWARDKDAFDGEQQTLRTARKRQAHGDHPPTPLTRLRRRVTSSYVGAQQVWAVRPRRGTPTIRVVYLHGGGYVHPLTSDYWRLFRALAGAAEVVVPAYPLAPDATVDEVLPGLLEVVEDGSHRLPTVLMGDSAGGALVLVLAQRLRDEGRARPVRLVALCPWLDATLDESTVADLEVTDPMLAETGLRAAGRWWAGSRRPSDPLVSPMNGDLKDLPPLDIYIGDHDILRPAVDVLARRGQAEGLRLHLHEVSAMFHVWMTRAIPEGRRTRRELVELLRSSPRG